MIDLGYPVKLPDAIDLYLTTIYDGGKDDDRIEYHQMLCDLYNLKKSDTWIVTDNLPVSLDFWDNKKVWREAYSLIFNGFQAIADMKREGHQFKSIEQLKEYLGGKGRKVFE